MWQRWSPSSFAHLCKELPPKPCTCLSLHFPASFRISSLPIMLCRLHACVFLHSLCLPPAQFSSPFPLLICPSQMLTRLPILSLVQVLVSAALQPCILLPLHCLYNWAQDRPCCSQHLLAWNSASSNYAERGSVPWLSHSTHSCVFRATCTDWPALRTERGRLHQSLD